MKLLNWDGESDLSSIEEFYQEWVEKSRDQYTRERAVAMCRLLARLHEVDDDSTWYCCTSHELLTLWRSRRTDEISVVTICGTGISFGQVKLQGLTSEDAGQFAITYPIPQCETPWPGAVVQLDANTIPDALAAIRIAIENCG